MLSPRACACVRACGSAGACMCESKKRGCFCMLLTRVCYVGRREHVTFSSFFKFVLCLQPCAGNYTKLRETACIFSAHVKVCVPGYACVGVHVSMKGEHERGL